MAEASDPLTGLLMPPAQEEMLPETILTQALLCQGTSFLAPGHMWLLSSYCVTVETGEKANVPTRHSCLGTSVRSHVSLSAAA